MKLYSKDIYIIMEKIMIVMAISLAIIFIFVPLMMAGLWSLVSAETPWSYPDMFPQKLSFHRWGEVWNYTAIKTALLNSYSLAPMVSLIVVSISMPTAYVIGRYNFRGKAMLEILFLMPLMIPGILVAVFFVQALNLIGFYNKYWGIVIGHTFATLPYGIRILTAAFSKVPQDQIDAARDLGAKKWKVFITAYLPLIRPAMFVAFLFVFIRSIEEFAISYILGSPDFVTVPTILFSFLGYNFVRPSAAVVSLILLIPNVTLMFFLERIMRADTNIVSGVKG